MTADGRAILVETDAYHQDAPYVKQLIQISSCANVSHAGSIQKKMYPLSIHWRLERRCNCPASTSLPSKSSTEAKRYWPNQERFLREETTVTPWATVWTCAALKSSTRLRLSNTNSSRTSRSVTITHSLSRAMDTCSAGVVPTKADLDLDSHLKLVS